MNFSGFPPVFVGSSQPPFHPVGSQPPEKKSRISGEGDGPDDQVENNTDELNPAAVRRESTPLTFVELSHKASALADKGLLTEATEHYEKALALPGGDRDLFTVSHYARHLHRLKNQAGAEKYYLKAFNIPGGREDLFARSRYALFLKETGNFAAAEAEIDIALTFPGGNQDLFTLLCQADILFNQSKFAQARLVYEKVLSFPEGKKNAGAWSLYAQTLFALGEFKEIITVQEAMEFLSKTKTKRQ